MIEFVVGKQQVGDVGSWVVVYNRLLALVALTRAELELAILIMIAVGRRGRLLTVNFYPNLSTEAKLHSRDLVFPTKTRNN